MRTAAQGSGSVGESLRLGRGPVPTSRRHRGFGKQAEESRAAQCQSERRTPPAEVAETVIKAQGPRLFVQSSSHVGICLVGTVQYRVLLVLGSVLSRLLSPGACELTFSSSPSSCASSLFQPESRCDGGRWREGEKVDGPGSSGSSWTKADMVGHDPGRPSSRPYPYPYPWSGEAENSTAGREEQETRQRSVCGQVGRTTQPQISLERALLLLSPPLFRISHLAPADGWHLMRRGQGLDSAMGSVKCAVCSVQCAKARCPGWNLAGQPLSECINVSGATAQSMQYLCLVIAAGVWVLASARPSASTASVPRQAREGYRLPHNVTSRPSMSSS